MFEFPNAISESDAIKSRIDSKNTDSPVEQPVNEEVVELSKDDPVEEVATQEATPEAEELVDEQASVEPEDDTEEDLYVEYKGREINLKDVETWEQDGLRQADYTRKTQELSEARKAFDSEKGEFQTKLAELNSKLAEANAIIEEGNVSEEQLAEWREYEPEKYIEYTEKLSKRKKLIADTQAPSVDMNKVSAELFANHPEWVVDGKQSPKFAEDTTKMTNYAESRGITQADIATFDARMFEVMLDASRFQEISKSNASIEKRVRKAPVSTKPRAQTKSHITSDIEALEAKVRKHGRNEDFVKLRQLKRQLNK